MILLAIVSLGVVVFVLDSFFPPGTQQQGNMKLTSSAFNNSQSIPQKYTCQGEDISPPLEISVTPKGTQSLVLIVDDPDAPLGTFTHWVVYNIPPETTSIAENSLPQGALQGINSGDKSKYNGPCPPSGTHHYVFKLYALDTTYQIKMLRDKKSVEDFMESHIITQAQLIGVYSKQ